MLKIIKNDLQKIYSIIPDIQCKHCHRCCRNIIWFEPENILIKDFLKNNYHNLPNLKNSKINNKNKCPFLNDSGCSIYPVRPIVCRFQGNVKELKCNLNKNIEFMNIETLNKIKKEFINLLIKTDGLNYFYSSRNINIRSYYDSESRK